MYPPKAKKRREPEPTSRFGVQKLKGRKRVGVEQIVSQNQRFIKRNIGSKNNNRQEREMSLFRLEGILRRETKNGGKILIRADAWKKKSGPCSVGEKRW